MSIEASERVSSHTATLERVDMAATEAVDSVSNAKSWTATQRRPGRAWVYTT